MPTSVCGVLSAHSWQYRIPRIESRFVKLIKCDQGDDFSNLLEFSFLEAIYSSIYAETVIKNANISLRLASCCALNIYINAQFIIICIEFCRFGCGARCISLFKWNSNVILVSENSRSIGRELVYICFNRLNQFEAMNYETSRYLLIINLHGTHTEYSRIWRMALNVCRRSDLKISCWYHNCMFHGTWFTMAHSWYRWTHNG